MKSKSMVGLFLLLLPLLFIYCSNDDNGMSKGDAQKLVGQQDLPYDICKEGGWYGDGICDLFCPETDPDCESAVCSNGGVCTDGAWCKMNFAYDDDGSAIGICLSDGSCITKSDCEYQLNYNRIETPENCTGTDWACVDGLCRCGALNCLLDNPVCYLNQFCFAASEETSEGLCMDIGTCTNGDDYMCEEQANQGLIEATTDCTPGTGMWKCGDDNACAFVCNE